MQEQVSLGVDQSEEIAEKQKETVESLIKGEPISPFSGLTVGRNVHYVEAKDTHYVAFVTGHVNAQTGACDLAILNNETKKIDWRNHVEYAPPEQRMKRTWHWIEQA